MISILQGKIVEKNESEAVLLTSAGIGFSVTCSANTLSALPAGGEETQLYTYMNVKEDGVDLFGFTTKDERNLFKRLISVSGVGPKIAVAVLGSMPLSDLRLAILTGDDKALCRAPGIGKKTAQRIALELKDKLTDDTFQLSGGDISPLPLTENDLVSEAMLALKSLGYSQSEAASAIRAVQGDCQSADELIRRALRQMVQNG